jgi:AAA domain
MSAEVKEQGEQQKVVPFSTRTGMEIINSSPEKYSSLVEDMLLETGVSMLCAKPKTGKSTFARQLSVSVAKGRDFLGKPTQQGDVLILNLEGPVGVLQQHLRKLGYSEERGVIHIVNEQMPFRGEEGLEKLYATLDSLPAIRLVIVDPIAKFLRLADSDDYDQVSLAIEKLEQVAKNYELHLMILTHAKKRHTDDVGDSPIGSTGFRGGTDTNIFLNKRGLQRVISTEQRWGTAMEPTLLLFDEEQQAMVMGSTVEEEQLARHEAKDRKTQLRIEKEIWNGLRERSNPTQQELVEVVTGKTATILEVLSQMVSSGRVMVEREGKSVRYRTVVCHEPATVAEGKPIDAFVEQFG